MNSSAARVSDRLCRVERRRRRGDPRVSTADASLGVDDMSSLLEDLSARDGTTPTTVGSGGQDLSSHLPQASSSAFCASSWAWSRACCGSCCPLRTRFTASCHAVLNWASAGFAAREKVFLLAA